MNGLAKRSLNRRAYAPGDRQTSDRPSRSFSPLRRALSYILLVVLYGISWVGSVLGNCLPHSRWRPNGRIIVTGTFHNPNWYLSHLTPISRCGVKEVILIVDEPQLPIDRVRFVCPPKWVVKFLGRALAKAIWIIGSGVRYNPDLYMGYYVLPGACSALLAGSLLGRPACYQMTGGPVEISGGEKFGGRMVRDLQPYRLSLLEHLGMAVIRQFDLVVVRGSKARRLLERHGLDGRVTIITGSVNPPRFRAQMPRDIDMVFVGRLAKIKQPWQFVEVLSAVRRSVPDVRAIIVGQGPLMDELKSKVMEFGLSENIEFFGKRTDVEAFLLRSKVIVLTSRSEGLSIAMAEGMASGVVPVVANVGELADLVDHGTNGFLITPNRIDEYATRIVSVLRDDQLRSRCAKAAAEAATSYCHLDIVTQNWRKHLSETISRSCGIPAMQSPVS